MKLTGGDGMPTQVSLVKDSPGDVRMTQETQEELAFLQAHPCDEAQGYFFSRPVPPQRLRNLAPNSVR